MGSWPSGESIESDQLCPGQGGSLQQPQKVSKQLVNVQPAPHHAESRGDGEGVMIQQLQPVCLTEKCVRACVCVFLSLL